MWPESNQIPIEPVGKNRPVKQHHSASYYAHRVKESLTKRVLKLICATFLTFLLVVIVTAFILWLSLRPHRPRFHVREFSIPALAQQGGFQNAQIIYNVTARDVNQNMGVYYDSMHLAVFYEDQRVGGSPVLFPFYQKPKNTTVIAGELGGATLTVTSQRWQQFLADLSRGEVIFRLDFTSTLRFRIWSWDSKHHRMHVHCPVGVGPDGFILPSYRDRRCPLYFS